MKKNISRILSIFIMLVLTASALFACGGDEVCTEHKDDDANLICDICEAPLEPNTPECEHRDEDADYECDKCGVDFFPECYDHINENGNAYCDICGEDLPINIIFKVCDQEGGAISGITLFVVSIDDEVLSGTTNSQGEIVLSLLVGNYRVSYDETTVPEGYIAYSTSVQITAEESTVSLELINNVPNGTMERPFVIDSELETSSVIHQGGEKLFYIVPHGGSRIVSFIGVDYEIVYYAKTDDEYNLKVYTPDEDGKITFRFTETDIKTPSLFTIENKASAEAEIVVELKSEPGTMAKPYEITDISSATICEGEKGKTIYYKWFATESGELIVTAPIMLYSMRIGSTEAVILNKNDGEPGILGVYSAITAEGAISLEILEEKIVVVESEIASILVGSEYKYEIGENGKLVIKDSLTEALVEPFAIAPAGRVVTVTNNRNSSQQRIEEGEEEIRIIVEDGDEIVIVIYTAFDMDVEINIGY